MNEETIDRLTAKFAEHPVLRGRPAADAAIESAQQRLKCRFDRDYIEFLRRFGSAVVGPNSIFGIGVADAMGEDEEVVEQTERFRAQRWPGVGNWYIVSVDGRGNPIGIAPDGKVRLSDHDVGDISDVAESYEMFLVNCCLNQ